MGATEQEMKVTVRIHRPTGLEFKTKKIEHDGKVTLRKGKGKAEWRPKITGLGIQHKMFGRVKYYADIFPDAAATWTPDFSKASIDTPGLTKEQIMEFGDWDALKARFRSIKDMSKTPMIMYVILIVQIMSIVLTFLISSGRLRL
jgi:hypothetical protein